MAVFASQGHRHRLLLNVQYQKFNQVTLAEIEYHLLSGGITLTVQIFMVKHQRQYAALAIDDDSLSMFFTFAFTFCNHFDTDTAYHKLEIGFS